MKKVNKSAKMFLILLLIDYKNIMCIVSKIFSFFSKSESFNMKIFVWVSIWKRKIKWPQILVIALSPITDILINRHHGMECIVATENNPFVGYITLLRGIKKFSNFLSSIHRFLIFSWKIKSNQFYENIWKFYDVRYENK